MEEYVESTRKGKFYFYGWLLLMALVVAGLDLYEQSGRNIDQPESITKEQLVAKAESGARVTLIVTVAIQPVFWLSAYFLYQFAKRIKASGRYPPHGAQMPFRTRVKTGKKAMLQASACIVSAVVMILFGIMYVYIGWLNFQTIERVLASV